MTDGPAPINLEDRVTRIPGTLQWDRRTGTALGNSTSPGMQSGRSTCLQSQTRWPLVRRPGFLNRLGTFGQIVPEHEQRTPVIEHLDERPLAMKSVDLNGRSFWHLKAFRIQAAAVDCHRSLLEAILSLQAYHRTLTLPAALLQ